jgi:hypothetical protein
MDDEELGRLISAANPARTPLDAPPDAALLTRIMTQRPPRPRPVVQRFAWLVAPLTALAVAVVAVVASVAGGMFSPAAAYGPPQLEWKPTQQTPAEVVEMAHQRLSTSVAQTPHRASTTTSWSLSVNDAGEPEEATTISPLVTSLAWQEDLSGERVVTAGIPYAIGGGEPTSDAVKPGTVIDDASFSAGEFPALAPDAGSLDYAGFGDFVAAYAPLDEGTKAGDAMLAISDVMSEWTLTNEQHRALLDVLFRYDGLQVEGTTTDRLGRAVIGLRSDAEFRPGESTTLLISADTGRIVGMEITVTGEDANAPVPVDTVTYYALWEDSE